MIVRLGVAALLLLPPAAFAQGNPGPFAGLFGRTPERTGRELTTLVFRSATGVEATQTLGDRISDDALPDGLSAGGQAGLSLDHLRDRWQLLAYGRGNLQQFLGERAFYAVSYDAGGQTSVKATNRLSFDFSGRASRSPFFQMLPPASADFTQVILPGAPFAARRIDNDAMEAVAGVTSQYSKRSSLSGWYSWRETRFRNERSSDFSARGARVQWRRRMNRDLTARVGYGREEIQQRGADADGFTHELIDIGVDYLRALSVARRTSLAVLTETSVLRESGRRRYRLNGGVDLQHSFRRTWRAAVGVHRATEFLPGFAQPLFSDVGRASIAGLLNNRMSFHANVSGGQSQIGFDTPSSFLTYSGDARLTVAATRRFGVFAQYVYYHYQLPADAQGAILLPNLSRQSVSIGVQTWFPIVNREKVPRDPR